MARQNQAANGSILRGLLVACALAGLAAVAATLMLAEEAEASHFRSGTLYAVPTGGNTVSIQGRIAFRASFPNAPGPASFPCAPGSFATNGGAIGDPSNFLVQPITITDSAGGPSGIPAFTAKLQVLACNSVDDWFLGKLVDPFTGNPGITVTLPAPLDPMGQAWLVTWDSTARLAYIGPNWHFNNPEQPWRLQASINLQGTPDNPVRPFVMPIVQCGLSGMCTIPIPYLDDDANQTHTIRFSTPCEATGASCTFYQPGPCPPVYTSPGCGGALPAAVDGSDPDNLIMTWDTTGVPYSPGTLCKGTWSTQVMIEDRAYVGGPVLEKSPMDFLIHVCDPSGAPNWIPGPGESQTSCLLSPTIVAGGTINFSLHAGSQVSTSPIQIIPLEWPTGAVMSANVNGNPASATFTWDTTGVAPGQYLAVFFAQNADGLTAMTTCIVKIRILAPIPVDFDWDFLTTAPQNLTFDEVEFHDLTTLPPAYQVATRSYRWTFGDSLDPLPKFVARPTHIYQRGTNFGLAYPACMHLTLTFTGGPWTGTACHDVLVRNRPPIPFPMLMLRYGDLVRYVDAGGDRDGRIISWHWTWGDGTSSDSSTPMHRYQADGTYTVCLTTVDDQMLAATACTEVTVRLHPPWMDTDLDGVVDSSDNCPEVPNHSQTDGDHDGIGDACKPVPVRLDLSAPLPDPAQTGTQDRDADGIRDDVDVCPDAPDRLQSDLDLDGAGDHCDQDLDGDSVPQWGPAPIAVDNCPRLPNREQGDRDADGIGDSCEDAPVWDEADWAAAPEAGTPDEAPGALEGGLFGDGASTGGIVAAASALAILALVGLGTTLWVRRRWRQ